MASGGGAAGPAESVPPPAAFDELPGPVLRQGWLDKRKPGKAKSYDRRYCILVGRMLLYYKPSAKKWNAPTGVAVLSDGCCVKTVADEPELLWVSYDSKPEEWSFELKCASATEAQEWMAAFGADEVQMGPPEMLDFFAGKEIGVDEHNAIGKLMVMDHVDHDSDARVLAPGTDTPLPATGPKWREWLSPDNTDDVVVVPSLSLSPAELKKVTGVQFYEERSLGFSILQLCEPSKRVVFVTSAPVSEEVVQYYLRIVCGQRGVSPDQARERLLMLSCFDTTFDVNLSRKILARPRIINRIKEFIRPDNAYMVCFISTPDEAELASSLGLDVLGTHPELQYYGTKLGSRTLFAEAGILFPDGTDLVFTEEELAIAIAQLWERSKPRRVVVKLNEGFSGEGNALMKLDEAIMTKAGNTKRRAALIQKLFPQMEFVNDIWKHYRTGITKMGALGESWVEDVVTSPSCQVYITPDGHVEVISTHEQILDGQVFLGCEFPADEGYRAALQEGGMKVGKALAAHGAMERFAMDFVTVKRADGGWDCHAIEINLRWGGTTHPSATLRLLTHGHLDQTSGVYLSDKGVEKCYYATDNLKEKELQGLTPADLAIISQEAGLVSFALNST